MCATGGCATDLGLEEVDAGLRASRVSEDHDSAGRPGALLRQERDVSGESEPPLLSQPMEEVAPCRSSRAAVGYLGGESYSRRREIKGY